LDQLNISFTKSDKVTFLVYLFLGDIFQVDITGKNKPERKKETLSI